MPARHWFKRPDFGSATKPQSLLSMWFRERVGELKGRTCRIAIVAMARKLLIALWRFIEGGEIPARAIMRAA